MQQTNNPRSAATGPDRRVLVSATTALVIGGILVEAGAAAQGFSRPVTTLAAHLAGRPVSGWVAIAALLLVLFVVPRREAVIAVSFAAAAELAVQTVLLAAGAAPTTHLHSLGAGFVWALVGLSVTIVRRRLRGDPAGPFRLLLLTWAMVIAIPLSFTWLQLSIVASPQVLDLDVALVDEALGNPSWVLGELARHLPTGVMYVGAIIYGALSAGALGVAMYQLWAGRRAARSGAGDDPMPTTLLTGFLVIGLIGPIFYILFPVVGPVFAFAESERATGMAFADVWPLVGAPGLTSMPLTFDAETARNCMPSLHTAWTVLMFIHTRRDPVDGRRAPGPVRAAGTLWVTVTLLYILATGYHYAADILAGIVLALAVDAAVRRPAALDAAAPAFLRYGRVAVVTFAAVVFSGLLLSYRFLATEIHAGGLLAGAALVATVAAVWVLHTVVYLPAPWTRRAVAGVAELPETLYAVPPVSVPSISAAVSSASSSTTSDRRFAGDSR